MWDRLLKPTVTYCTYESIIYVGACVNECVCTSIQMCNANFIWALKQTVYLGDNHSYFIII